jgi:hypothetical protein
MPKRFIIDNDNRAHCMNAESGTCHMANLIVGAITAFHDSELAEASSRINQILREVRGRNEDSGRELMFLGIDDGGVLLAWARPARDSQSSQEFLRKTFAIVQTAD